MSNRKYRWHSSESSCEKCQALNNTEYDSEKEIPAKPHPNCKCYVEVVEEEPQQQEDNLDILRQIQQMKQDAPSSDDEEDEALIEKIKQLLDEFN